MQSYRHCAILTKDKKENCQNPPIQVKIFTIGCVFVRVGDWDDLQVDQNVSFHVGFKIQFAGNVPVFLEFSGHTIVANLRVYSTILPPPPSIPNKLTLATPLLICIAISSGLPAIS